MLGQDNLKSTFQQLIELELFPQFLILEGERGSGKKLMAEFIAEKLDAYIYYLPELKVDNIRETIDDAQTLNKNKVYVLADAEDMTAQAENAILKLAEEPPVHCYLIMTVDNRSSVLDTIRSRAKIYKMQPYTQEQLMHFTRDLRLLNLCETPGQIEQFVEADMDALFKFADKVIDKITVVSVMNMFAIPKYLNIDGKSEDKYDLKMFLAVLTNKLLSKMKNDVYNKTMYFDMMLEVSSARSLLRVKGINKQALIDMMLSSLRRIAKNEG